jgi:hypothetical protein
MSVTLGLFVFLLVIVSVGGASLPMLALTCLVLCIFGVSLTVAGPHRWNSLVVSGFLLIGSLGQVVTNHGGTLLFFWMMSGGALTLLVRLEGGETASKPGRILQMQQHGSSVLLFGVIIMLVAGSGSWILRSGMATFGISYGRLLSMAGLRAQTGAGIAMVPLAMIAAVALRLGLFPFPFSSRRTARRLRGSSLLIFLALFLPSSLWAISKLYAGMLEDVGAILPIGTALLGVTALITGGLWLQTEWQVGALVGHLVQAYIGLGLIGLAVGGPAVLGPHLVQTAIIAGVVVVWEYRIHSLVGSSDLSRWAEGYRNQPSLWKPHLLVILMAIPWPGTPAGNVWLLALGRDLLLGSGIGLLTVAGVGLVVAGMLRSLQKVASRTAEASLVASPGPFHMTSD